MSPTDAQRKAIAKWQKEKVEEIKFRVPMGEKTSIQEHAKSQGESTNAFIYRAVNETIARDQEKHGKSD